MSMYRRSPRRPKTEDPEQLEDRLNSEIDDHQSVLANMLTMGTLVFGFCATGTFLSVSFTGDESWDKTDQFVAFLSHGSYSAIFSLTATMIVFVFSTRVANQRMQHGASVAYRTVQMSTFFIMLAEMLLYLSLQEFMGSISVYAHLEYQGPKICPMIESNGYIYNASFCAQLGDEFFTHAGHMCGNAQSIDIPRAIADTAHPVVTCTGFDHYSAVMAEDPDEVPGTWWFAWDWGETGYDLLHENYGMEQMQAFYQLINEVSDHVCDKQSAARRYQNCAEGTAEPTAVCAQAQTALFMADSCSGQKQADVLKCKKVCGWIAGFTGLHWYPLREVIDIKLEMVMNIMIWIIRIFMVLRACAGAVKVFKRCQKKHQKDGICSVGFLDVCGVFDFVDKDDTDPEEVSDEDVS